MVIRARLFFFAVIAFGCLLFFAYLSGTGGDFKIEYIRLKDIDSIKVDDRGLVGTNSIVFHDKDTNSYIGTLLKKSKPVDGDKQNLRDNYGLCDIEIYLKNKNLMRFHSTGCNKNGGIIQSGVYFYRNDSLLTYVVAHFKNQKQ